MSEDEAIQKCKNIVSHKNDKDIVLGKNFIHHYMMSIEDHEAIETILDLYNKEKEKNKELDSEIIRIRATLNEVTKEYISKDKIRDMQRYREFELQQEYKDFENDVEWKTYNKILEEGNNE